MVDENVELDVVVLELVVEVVDKVLVVVEEEVEDIVLDVVELVEVVVVVDVVVPSFNKEPESSSNMISNPSSNNILSKGIFYP